MNILEEQPWDRQLRSPPQRVPLHYLQDRVGAGSTMWELQCTIWKGVFKWYIVETRSFCLNLKRRCFYFEEPSKEMKECDLSRSRKISDDENDIVFSNVTRLLGRRFFPGYSQIFFQSLLSWHSSFRTINRFLEKFFDARKECHIVHSSQLNWMRYCLSVCN